jgi:hypothetical protein
VDRLISAGKPYVQDVKLLVDEFHNLSLKSFHVVIPSMPVITTSDIEAVLLRKDTTLANVFALPTMFKNSASASCAQRFGPVASLIPISPSFD